MNIISLKNIKKYYDNNLILDNFNLDINEGEFVTILGPSGCGKTTILRIIAGFEKVNEGSVILENIDVTDFPPHQRNVNTVFQSYALFPHLNVFDNVAFGLKIKKLPKKEITKRVKEALETVHLFDMDKRSIFQLSGGQQQRVAIARAIINKPRVLLLDEPLSSLDYKLRKTMQIELKQLHRKLGITFIFVTHDQEEAITMSDKIIVMNNGKVEQMGTPKEVYEKPQNLYVAKFLGDVNIFDAKILKIEGKKAIVSVLNKNLEVILENSLSENTNIKILLRPEDLIVYKKNDYLEDKFYFEGVVEEYIYKGTTVDLIVKLDTGQNILITQFFNEEAADIEYSRGEKLTIGWYLGWEVILPDER
jgi:spermidine/putrescine transport system ATP-binding protein